MFAPFQSRLPSVQHMLALKKRVQVTGSATVVRGGVGKLVTTKFESNKK